MKIEQALESIIQGVEETAGNWPPRIELEGWWWKKYVPHYRKTKKVLQMLIDEEWKNNHDRILEFREWVEKEERGNIIGEFLKNKGI